MRWEETEDQATHGSRDGWCRALPVMLKHLVVEQVNDMVRWII